MNCVVPCDKSSKNVNVKFAATISSKQAFISIK